MRTAMIWESGMEGDLRQAIVGMLVNDYMTVHVDIYHVLMLLSWTSLWYFLYQNWDAMEVSHLCSHHILVNVHSAGWPDPAVDSLTAAFFLSVCTESLQLGERRGGAGSGHQQPDQGQDRQQRSHEPRRARTVHPRVATRGTYAVRCAAAVLWRMSSNDSVKFRSIPVSMVCTPVEFAASHVYHNVFSWEGFPGSLYWLCDKTAQCHVYTISRVLL